MTDSLLAEVSALREKAWGEVTASPSFASFKALDTAVVSMGGKSILRDLGQSDGGPSKMPTYARGKLTVRKRRRPSQGDVAYSCLQQHGAPLHIRTLMDKVIERGVKISGADPLPNFRSTLSRDNRFTSIMKDGGYYWWLTASPVPVSWKEAESRDLLNQPSASESSSQKGGDGHAANNT